MDTTEVLNALKTIHTDIQVLTVMVAIVLGGVIGNFFKD